MKLTRRDLPLLLMLGLALLLAAAEAAAFQVRPVRLDLGARRPAGQLVVSNPTARPLLIQADAFDWTQQDGQDQLAASQRLVINPPIFELAPGAAQVVRIGLRDGAEPGVERSHRIWLSQVATPGAADDEGVQLLLRVSLPVFVLGTDTGAPQPQWRHDAAARHIELANPGARHLHVRELRLAGAQGTPTRLGPCYALPGSRCRWAVPAELGDQPPSIEADSDAGLLRSRLDAPASP